MKTRWLLLVVLGTGFFYLTAGAADWPQWRGPSRDGISQETGQLKEWPKSGPKLLWQAKDIDFGYSTPSIVGDRVYLMSNKGADDEFVLALSAADGKRLWATRVGKVGPNGPPNYPGARSTPTVDGDVLYALGSDGDLACIQTAAGSVVWKKSLRSEFGGKPGTWAYAESPLVDGDVLVCTPGGKEATIVALNKKSGDVIWKSPIVTSTGAGEQAAYASAIVDEVGGVKQYVQFLQKGIVGVDAKSGKLLWRYDKTGKSAANIPTPVAHGAYVYSSSGQGGAGLVKLAPDGDAFKAEQVYFDRKLPTSIGGAVRVGEYLYGTSGKGLMCVEFATGNVKWQEKGVGPGSVCYADGRLYVHGESGDMALVEATPEAYREKGRFTPPDRPERKGRNQSQSWSYPVIADGKLYLRDLGVLWCYDVKEHGPAQ
jgi:outer membrane protein assembly factor BamB